jgi:hypothetical protein
MLQLRMVATHLEIASRELLRGVQRRGFANRLALDENPISGAGLARHLNLGQPNRIALFVKAIEQALRAGAFPANAYIGCLR